MITTRSHMISFRSAWISFTVVSVGASVCASVGDNVSGCVCASVGGNVGGCVGKSVGDNVGGFVGASVGDNVGGFVGASVVCQRVSPHIRRCRSYPSLWREHGEQRPAGMSQKLCDRQSSSLRHKEFGTWTGSCPHASWQLPEKGEVFS
jgi:hypothetical protein